MRLRIRLAVLGAAAVPALAACAAEGDFPSLALRPAELNRSVEEPVRPAPQVADDAALRRRIAELGAVAAEGAQGFDAALGAAEAAAAAAGAAESESWIAAQQALSRLEASRAPTMRALAELDRLALDRADLAASAADVAALDAAAAAIRQIAAAQQERLDRLRGRLSR